MRAAEAATQIAEGELMRRAGDGAAEWVWRIAAGRSVTVLCGPGNNGGDGYVIASSLHRRGIDVLVIAPGKPATMAACAARADYDGPITAAPGARHGAVLVDALFGYGLSREIAGGFEKVLEETHASHDYHIAIDVPSGVACDTGAWLGTPRAYDLTLALGAWKRAHWLMPASAAMGETRLVEIGIAAPDGSERLSQMPRLSAPSPDSHKYRRGLVAIVAGAMPGAAVLSGEAALRAGAGYVKLMHERAVPNAPPELVITDPQALDEPRIAALLVGPGLGRDHKARMSLAAALDTAKPIVIDADALHLLDWYALEGVASSRLLLTPHEGELAALCTAFGVTANTKPARAAALRDATGASVLAKGPDTLLAPAGGGLVFFPAASPWLSAAGTGDVLAGIAAARLAFHCGDGPRAAEEAVWLHREAARLAGPAFTAGDLARTLPRAMAALL